MYWMQNALCIFYKGDVDNLDKPKTFKQKMPNLFLDFQNMSFVKVSSLCQISIMSLIAFLANIFCFG